MATIVVLKNGRPVANAQVRARTTGEYSQNDYSGRTGSNGKCILNDGVNRYYIEYHNGFRWENLETIPQLRGEITVHI